MGQHTSLELRPTQKAVGSLSKCEVNVRSPFATQLQQANVEVSPAFLGKGRESTVHRIELFEGGFMAMKFMHNYDEGTTFGWHAAKKFLMKTPSSGGSLLDRAKKDPSDWYIRYDALCDFDGDYYDENNKVVSTKKKVLLMEYIPEEGKCYEGGSLCVISCSKALAGKHPYSQEKREAFGSEVARQYAGWKSSMAERGQRDPDHLIGSEEGDHNIFCLWKRPDLSSQHSYKLRGSDYDRIEPSEIVLKFFDVGRWINWNSSQDGTYEYWHERITEMAGMKE